MADIIYSKEEERVNSLSHAFGIVMGLAVCSYFLVRGYESGNTLAIVSLWLYTFGVVSSYVLSTVYHALPATSRWKPRFRKLDHAAIYWHIAGSYSPVTLIALAGVGYWGWGIFSFCWIAAITGTFISLFRTKKKSYVETACYVLMGLTILVAFKPFWENVNHTAIYWILGEGIAYITGAVFYSFHKTKYVHSVFHFFVLLGDICHMIALYIILNEHLPAHKP